MFSEQVRDAATLVRSVLVGHMTHHSESSGGRDMDRRNGLNVCQGFAEQFGAIPCCDSEMGTFKRELRGLHP